MADSSLPDMEFIRQRIKIQEVFVALGEQLSGRNTGHCWRIEHHKNGDRTASISFRKNRATCYVCDPRPLSTIDLVSAHEHLSLMNAVRWICARWDVPSVQKGKFVRSERWHSGRVGVSGSPLESLVRS